MRLGSREDHGWQCPLMTSSLSTGPAANGPAIPLHHGKTSSEYKVQLGGSHWPCLNPMPHCLNLAVLWPLHNERFPEKGKGRLPRWQIATTSVVEGASVLAKKKHSPSAPVEYNSSQRGRQQGQKLQNIPQRNGPCFTSDLLRFPGEIPYN